MVAIVQWHQLRSCSRSHCDVIRRPRDATVWFSLDGDCVCDASGASSFPRALPRHTSTTTSTNRTRSTCSRLQVFFSLKETLVFVEALCDSSSDVPSSLRVRSLVETEPESRYSRMLNRGRFTEAESLAKLYDLDLKVPTLNWPLCALVQCRLCSFSGCTKPSSSQILIICLRGMSTHSMTMTWQLERRTCCRVWSWLISTRISCNVACVLVCLPSVRPMTSYNMSAIKWVLIR